jgi:RNA-binding protein
MSDDHSRKLSPERRKALRAIGHTLHPVVTVAGKGLSEAVLAEINRALDDHELVKVRISVGDRELKQRTISGLCEKTGADLVQTIGHVALILKEAKKSRSRLSNLPR